LSGYIRQSSADIIPTAVVRATPINNEFNALRDAFNASTGHKHDGTAGEGPPITLIGDSLYGLTKVFSDGTNNRISIYTNVSSTSTEQVRFATGVFNPVVTNAIDIGTSSLKFKDLYLAGNASLVTASASGQITSTIAIGTAPFAVTSTTKVVNLNSDLLDGADWASPAPIGSTAASTITGTTITASTGFVGPLTGAVTGNTTGTHTGAVTGNVTGDITGNVTASTGTSSFYNVTINNTLDMNSGTAGTITGLASPTNGTDAAHKTYVDTADALRLLLSGGTMSGAIAMGTNKITGLGTPTAGTDATTKTYVDTQITNLINSAPAALDTLNELAAALGNDASFATTVTNSLAGKLSLTGGTMSGAIAMGTSKITGLGTPTLSADATTKTYVDTADALKLNLTGGTMSGAIAMGTSKITGLGTPTAGTDATTKTYVDTAVATSLLLAGGTMSGAINMGTSKITNLGTPTANADATTKLYVDGILGSATSAAASAAAAAVSESNAATSASNASTSASNASTSASNASTSATNAASSYTSFDNRYLGAKSSAPSLNNSGGALLTGSLYFDTTLNQLYTWTGSAWTQAAFTTGSFVLGPSSATDGAVPTFDGTTGKLIKNNSGVSITSGVITATSATFNGTGAIILPAGTNGQQPSGVTGMLRFNSSTTSFEGYNGSAWGAIGGGGVTSFSAGTTGFTPSTSTTGAVTLSGTLVGTNGGTGVNNGSKTITLGGNLTTSGAFNTTITATATTAVTLPTSGTIMSSVTALSGAVTGTPSSTTYLRGDGTWASVNASPGGSTTQVQFNNAGVFGGSASFTWDGSSVTAPQHIASNGLMVNNQTIATSYSIPSGYAASSVGPVTLGSGVSVTVPSGGRWVVL
jgi:hypothetical protein